MVTCVFCFSGCPVSTHLFLRAITVHLHVDEGLKGHNLPPSHTTYSMSNSISASLTSDLSDWSMDEQTTQLEPLSYGEILLGVYALPTTSWCLPFPYTQHNFNCQFLLLYLRVLSGSWISLCPCVQQVRVSGS